MTIIIILILILSLLACLVGTVSGYSGATAQPGTPPRWTLTNFLALGVALYVLVQLLNALGVR